MNPMIRVISSMLYTSLTVHNNFSAEVLDFLIASSTKGWKALMLARDNNNIIAFLTTGFRFKILYTYTRDLRNLCLKIALMDCFFLPKSGGRCVRVKFVCHIRILEENTEILQYSIISSRARLPNVVTTSPLKSRLHAIGRGRWSE